MPTRARYDDSENVRASENPPVDSILLVVNEFCRQRDWQLNREPPLRTAHNFPPEMKKLPWKHDHENIETMAGVLTVSGENWVSKRKNCDVVNYNILLTRHVKGV